jgi:hypothetical protein
MPFFKLSYSRVTGNASCSSFTDRPHEIEMFKSLQKSQKIYRFQNSLFLNQNNSTTVVLHHKSCKSKMLTKFKKMMTAQKNYAESAKG